MEKIPRQLEREELTAWLHLVDEMLFDSEISFEEFTGHALRRELKEAGEALARAEGSIRRARAYFAARIIELERETEQ